MNIHELGKVIVENIIKISLIKQTFDNVTVVFVAFQAFKDKLYPKNFKKIL